MLFKWLTIFFLAASPISELRGAIPLGVIYYKFAPDWVFVVSVLGNILPIYFILTYLPLLEKWLRRHGLLVKLMDAIFKRTRHKFGPNYYRYGNLALCLFVAIPLPATGVWTGALAAWLFGIPKASAFFYMALGALAAGFIVLAATLGVVNIKL